MVISTEYLQISNAIITDFGGNWSPGTTLDHQEGNGVRKAISLLQGLHHSMESCLNVLIPVSETDIAQAVEKMISEFTSSQLEEEV